MVHFKVSAVLPLPAHIFFVERDSAAFRSLVAKVMKLGGLEILDGWMDGDVEVYQFVTRPDIDKFVPKRLQHYLPNGNLFYIDIIEYDPRLLQGSPFQLRVTSIPPIFPNKAHIACTLTIEEETHETCRQTLEGDVDIRIFGLGALAERIIADNLKKVYSGIPPIVARWAEFRQEVLKHPRGKEVLVSGRPDNHDIPWISQQIQDLLQEPLQPAYELGQAPGMTQQLHLGRTAKDAMQLVEANRSGKDRGFEQEGGKARNGPIDLPGRSDTAQADTRPSEAAAAAAAAAPEPSPRSAAAASSPQRSEASLTLASELSGRHGGGQPLTSDSDEEFEDALEDSPWLHDDVPRAESTATSDQIAEDHKAATLWYRSFKKAKEPQPESIAIDADTTPRARPPLNAKPLASKRFSTEFKEDYDMWSGFWDRQKVPEHDHVPELRARLVHLLGLGAAWGLIKPGSHKHSRTSSTGNAPSNTSAKEDSTPSSQTLGAPTEQSPQAQQECVDSAVRASSTGRGDERQPSRPRKKGVSSAFRSCFQPSKTRAVS